MLEGRFGGLDGDGDVGGGVRDGGGFVFGVLDDRFCCCCCFCIALLPTIRARCSRATVVRVSMSLVWNSSGGVFILRIVINSEPSPCRNVCLADSGDIVIPL